MFTFPALLWFLPILGAVVLIHLINMFRHRKVAWGAMEFILASYRKSRTRILLQQLLLMLLRTLAVAGIILSFAGPKLEGTFAGWLGSRGTHHIVLLDDSYSMNERNLALGGAPLFEDALAVVRQIAENKPNDRFTLIKLSEVNGISCAEQNSAANHAHDPETMLVAADELVRQTVRLKPVVYFLSDFRRRNWENPTPILQQIETIRRHGGTVRMIRIAQAEQPNLGIEQIALVDGIHAADVDILLDATVVNYSTEPAENVLVTLFVDDQMRAQQTIPRLLPGSKTTPPLRFPVRVSGSEPHRIEVRLQPDALPDDNQRYIALHVPDVLEVLLIAPSLSAPESSAPYVRVALSPGSAKSGIRVRQETPAYLAEKPLEPFHAIFLVDLPSLEPSALRALEHYVANGGGVAFFPGPTTDLDFVRNQLYKNGAGLFPAAPVGVQELLPDYLTKIADVRILPHPIFRLFGEGESPLLGSIIIERYLAVEPASDSSVNVWATLRNDAPLVLEKKFGAGRTMTFLTSASPVWNNWARNPSYVVVLLELTAWLSKRQEQLQTLLVGDPMTVQINPMEFEEHVQWTVPAAKDGIKRIAMTATEDGLLTATFTQTGQPGFYTITKRFRSGAEYSELRAVNVNAEEGDIRPLDITEIADILRPARQPLESAASFSPESDFVGQQSVGDWLLYATILFLVGEIFLAGRMLPPGNVRTNSGVPAKYSG